MKLPLHTLFFVYKYAYLPLIAVAAFVIWLSMETTFVRDMYARAPYLTGIIPILVLTILSVWWYEYQNSKDPESEENEYGFDYALSVGVRLFIGVCAGGIYAILVAMTR